MNILISSLTPFLSVFLISYSRIYSKHVTCDVMFYHPIERRHTHTQARALIHCHMIHLSSDCQLVCFRDKQLNPPSYSALQAEKVWQLLTNMLEGDLQLRHAAHLSKLMLFPLAFWVIIRLRDAVFTCSVNLFRFWKSVLTESGKTSLVKWSCIFTTSAVSAKTRKSSSTQLGSAQLSFNSGFSNAHAP